MFTQRLRKYSKPLICIAGCLLFVVWTMTLAQGTPTPLENKLNDAQFLNQLIELLAWLWIPLAMIAGKLMTNTFVFGEFINFDIYLRGMWNISKVLANLTIGFFFFWRVRDLIFLPDKLTGSEVGKSIWWYLLAGVLIQASWFLVWATLDVETVTTAAAGALPALVIQENSDRWGQIITATRESWIVWSKISLNKLNNGSIDYQLTPPVTWTQTASNSEILDAILPSYNSLSGPLYFIWFSIFKFHKYATVSTSAINNVQDLSQVLTGTTIRVLIQLAFVIFMFLLIVINVIRVWYLWMIIALSPFIILLLVMKWTMWIGIIDKIEEGTGLKFDIATILAYIFQPTIIVIFMSLTLIAVTALWQWLGTGNINVQDYAGLTITDTGATHAAFEFASQGDIFDNFADNGKWIFKNLVMVWLIFAMLLWMITLSATSLKIEFIGSIAKKLQNSLINIPFIPIATMQTFWKNELAKAGINIGAWEINFDNKAANEFREMLWIKPEIDAIDTNELSKLTKDPINFFNKAQDLRDKRKWLSLAENNAFANNLVTLINNIQWDTRYWFTGFDEISGLKDKLKDGKLDVAHLADYLSYDKNNQALYQWMYKGKYEANKPITTAPTWSTEFANKQNILKEKFIDNSKKTP